ncbi:hypothetical protein GCM10012286_58150 [Streptomyces lasiicapitis]|uniref:Uncharacterized protein n=1 Tax=Streptomyces lasiicapitis TaxID=1923961 RepID=A0ABQ2MM36_9ACTN|nr:hypothetical protein GCM10012286_58150 [Streptomyces lasiicapitis]
MPGVGEVVFGVPVVGSGEGMGMGSGMWCSLLSVAGRLGPGLCGLPCRWFAIPANPAQWTGR